jgi:hypothetical protein
MLALDKLLRLPSSGNVQDSLLVDERRMPLVSQRDLPVLAALGTEAFGDAGPQRYGLNRLDFYGRVLASSPRSCRFLLDATDAQRLSCSYGPNDAVGFVCVLPFRPAAASALASGTLSQFELNESHLVSQSMTAERNLFLQGVYLQPSKRFLLREMFHSLTRVMADFVSFDADRSGPVLFAEVTTLLGRRTQMNMGWTPHGTSKDGNILVWSRPEHELTADGSLSRNRRTMMALTRTYAMRRVEGQRV